MTKNVKLGQANPTYNFQTDILFTPTVANDQRFDDVKTRVFTSHQQPDQKPWLANTFNWQRLRPPFLEMCLSRREYSNVKFHQKRLVRIEIVLYLE